MLSWLGKGKTETSEKPWIDRVYIHTECKIAAIISLAKSDEAIVFVAWFKETVLNFQARFAAADLPQNRVQHADNLTLANADVQVVFVEHYPLHARELAFQQKCKQLPILVFSAMDEPLFKYFGSDNMLPLIKLLGMKETEAIEHSYVSQAITRGQEKIAAQVVVDLSANTQAAWMERHLPPRKS